MTRAYLDAVGPGLARIRISKWVHFHLGVDRFRFRDYWGSITLACQESLELLARGDWWDALRMARKAAKTYEIWQLKTGQRKRLGMDQLLGMLVQFARPGGAGGATDHAQG